MWWMFSRMFLRGMIDFHEFILLKSQYSNETDFLNKFVYIFMKPSLSHEPHSLKFLILSAIAMDFDIIGKYSINLVMHVCLLLN